MSEYLFMPAIQGFPAEGRIWRVDFLGGLERNPAIPDEPTVQVIVSPLRDASLRKPDELASVNAVFDNERMIVRIGVGQLPYLKIGSLWRKGRCLPYSAGRKQTYALAIDKAQGLYMAHRVVGGAQLIQSLYHRIGTGSGAFCVTLAYGGDPQGLIIPAMELLRFYYAVSTPLARALFMGDFLQNLNAVSRCGVFTVRNKAKRAVQSQLIWDFTHGVASTRKTQHPFSLLSKSGAFFCGLQSRDYTA